MNKLAVVQSEAMQPVPTDEVRAQVNAIQHLLDNIMKKDTHYGTIPGCGAKPTLLKAGAEKLCLAFRLAPEYEVSERQEPNGHREYRITCRLRSLQTDTYVGEGLGICSTMESKYRYRQGERVCPECGKAAIIKGRKEYGGGWLCFKKKDGCGYKWDDGDPAIEDQSTEKVEFDNPADYYNTVIKMAKKRAQVDAVLTATAASDIFTQDIEEMVVEVVSAPMVETEVYDVIAEPAKKAGNAVITGVDYEAEIAQAGTGAECREIMKALAQDSTVDKSDKVRLQLQANARVGELKKKPS